MRSIGIKAPRQRERSERPRRGEPPQAANKSCPRYQTKKGLPLEGLFSFGGTGLAAMAPPLNGGGSLKPAPQRLRSGLHPQGQSSEFAVAILCARFKSCRRFQDNRRPSLRASFSFSWVCRSGRESWNSRHRLCFCLPVLPAVELHP